LIDIARGLRNRRASARELVEAAIARHERFGERLHAYSFWAPEQARAVADAADAAFAAGVSAGPLQGLPVSLKDLFAADGYPCFAGSSRRLPADPWEQDGPLVATLRRQLGVIMGKTHMVEFAFGGTGHNCHHGAPYNPWDATAHRSVGGSSSGAGVSLLEGSAVLAFGSDTAGSVRIPACMTGNAGLKVTIGRWSTGGVVPLSFTFDTPGLLARSVCDLAYGFAALDPAGICVLAVRAPGDRHVGAALGEIGHRHERLADEPQKDPVRLAQYQQVAGLRDVLRRGAPMHPAAIGLAGDSAQLPNQGHDRMASTREPLVDPRAVEEFEMRGPPDRRRRALGDDPQLLLCLGECRLDIEPSLPAVFEAVERADTGVRFSRR